MAQPPAYGATGAYPPAQPPPPGPQYGQPGYNQQQQATVVVTQPVVQQAMREVPVNMVCPNCRAQIVTSTTNETGTLTWVACLILCLIGCDLGCCFIPFCISSCKDTVHHCPSCRTTLGKHNKM